MQNLPGYTFGATAARSPLNQRDFEELRLSVLFGDADAQALRTAGEILRPQVDAVLDVWYGFVGAHPHLLAYFANAQGQPQDDYLAAVRKRFGQWILDTCLRPYDATWLDYQHEIGLRHHRSGKNKTDRADAAPVVHLRHLVALIVPITLTIKPFLAKGGHSAAEVDAMHAAWFKSVTLQVALWSAPFVEAGNY